LKLLLDTHILLWSLLEPARLTKRTTKALSDPNNEIWISPISSWEILMLCQKKRLEIKGDPEKWLQTVLAQVPFKEAPLTHEVAMASVSVAVAHADPADRFLAASAQVYSLTLVTSDDNLLRGHGYKVLPNR
jgi:PIN domain nuclease of toxin-antitoxin system